MTNNTYIKTCNDATDFIKEDTSQTICVDESIMESEIFDEKNHTATTQGDHDKLTLSNLLRILGAVFVVLSMSLFLIQGWSESNDSQRYLKLLTQTGLLTVSGLFLTYILKENKGARVFLGLSLVSVVANFTILGALLYSIFQLDGNLVHYPGFATWKVTDIGQFLIIAVPAMVVLSLLTRIILTIFARHSVSKITITFLLLSALLLIPIRSGWFILPMAVPALWVASRVAKSLTHYQIDTLEGKFTKALLFIPAFILFGRNIGLYAEYSLMVLNVSLIIFVAIRQGVSRDKIPEGLFALLEFLRAFAAIGVVLGVSSIAESWNINSSLFFGMIVTLIVALTQDIIQPVKSLRSKSFIVMMPHLVIIVMVGLFIENNLWNFDSALLGLYASVLLIIQSYYNKTKFLLILNGVFLAGNIVIVILTLTQWVHVNNWIGIGIVGSVIIISASIIERHGHVIKHKLQKHFS